MKRGRAGKKNEQSGIVDRVDVGEKKLKRVKLQLAHGMLSGIVLQNT